MTLRQLSLSVDVVVWNNQGYGEIRDSMLARDVEPAGVDIASPDIVQLGAAFDIPAHRVTQPLDHASSMLICSTESVRH